MTKDKEHCLGELIQGIVFSSEEKTRLGNLVLKKGMVRSVFLANAMHTDPFKDVVKSIQVKGFSPGRAGHVIGGVERVIAKDLINGVSKNKRICWDIYKWGVVRHVIDNMPILNNLLLKVRAHSDQVSTPDLLRAICKNAKQFDVTQEMVKEFYELWGFDRVEDLDAYLIEECCSCILTSKRTSIGGEGNLRFVLEILLQMKK